MRRILVGLLFFMGGCAHTASADKADHSFQWIEGCWVTESEETREVWSIGSAEYVFGYNTLTKDEKVRFFEQMRLENSADGWHFVAYPKGIGPTHFLETNRSEQSVAFLNTETDYPQKITYHREGDKLLAEISLADGSNPNRWVFTRCDKD